MTKTKKPMPLLSSVPLDVLGPRLRKQVMKAYERAMGDPKYRMSYREAAHLYGVTYANLRYYAHTGELRVSGKPMGRRVTHAAMQALIKRPLKTGRRRNVTKRTL